jgi:hypothetical protein
MRGELAAPRARVSQITPDAYDWSPIVEHLQSADVLVMLVLSVTGLIIAILLLALFPFSAEIANSVAALS